MITSAVLQGLASRRWIARTLAGMAVVLVVATAVIAFFEQGWNVHEAFLTVLLVFASGELGGLELASVHPITRYFVVFTVYAGVLGIAMFMGFVVDVVLRARMPMLFEKRGRKMKDHIILCGLGHVGYRTLLELEKFGESVYVVEKDEGVPFTGYVAERKIPIIFDDVRKDDVLIKAGVDSAKAVIACTNNDLVNLEVAMDARDRRPDIRVIVRLFDQRLADKISKAFDIQIAFSSSALAAPAFAAAAVDRSVKSSFYVEDRLFVYSTFEIQERSPLAGKTVSQIRNAYEVNTIMLRSSAGEETWAPGPDVSLPAHGVVCLVGPFERVRNLGRPEPAAR